MFADNIWWTRKSRIQAEKRLLANAFQAQLLLIWYSFLSAAVSVYYLKATASSYANVSWVAFSVLILSISGFINGLSYKERANLIKECYESLQELYTQAKAADADISKINIRYQEILKSCENHEDIDYCITLCDTYLSHPSPKHHRRGLTKHPTCFIWLKVIFYYLKRCTALTILYLLPIGMFFAMEIGTST